MHYVTVANTTFVYLMYWNMVADVVIMAGVFHTSLMCDVVT